MNELRDSISSDILKFIKKGITGVDLSTKIINKHKITRQTFYKKISNLIDENFIIKTGASKAINYSLQKIKENFFFKAIQDTEDLMGAEILSFIKNKVNIKQNIKKILSYSLSEMLNNAIEHSLTSDIFVCIEIDFFSITMVIEDFGVGIFEKIKKEYELPDYLSSVIELEKGKLTTDKKRHTGEGIFFTSKLFSTFVIESNSYKYDFVEKVPSINSDKKNGTKITLAIENDSTMDLLKIFKKYTVDDKFLKTEIHTVLLTDYGHDLVSRSIARRILNRLDQFTEVLLDFEGVEYIGQAFADEIFRVYKESYPQVNITYTNANEEVLFMIKRGLL